jgi:thermitase
MKRKSLIILLSSVLFLFFTCIVQATPVHSQEIPQAPAAPDEIILKYKSNTPESEKVKMHAENNAARKHRIDKLSLEVVDVPKGHRDTAIKQYKHNTYVAYAEPNFKAQAFGITDDVALSQQWGLFKIDAANQAAMSAWDITEGNQSVKVAILDTGIDSTHTDLAGKIAGSSNFTTSSTLDDTVGHGTHVAGITAAATNNGLGVAGTGYNTVLLNGKVLDDSGSGYYSWIASGIVWAADNGAQVINMSLGGSASSQALQDAVNYAWSKGVVVVAAAGNSNTNAPMYPGYYTNVIAVAATDSNDQRANFSNFGNWVDVAAPGVSIYSTYKGNSYATLSGTSMATPFAAGTAALIWAKGYCTTNTCVRTQLEQTADKISGTGSLWAWGRINAYKAVTTIVPLPTPTNTPAPTATPTPTPVKSMTVSSITMSKTALFSTTSRISSVITVTNEATNTSFAMVSVKGTITTPSGSISSFSGTSGSNGKVTINLNSKEKGTFITTITGLTKSSYSYHPTVTSQSLLVQ